MINLKDFSNSSRSHLRWSPYIAAAFALRVVPRCHALGWLLAFSRKLTVKARLVRSR